MRPEPRRALALLAATLCLAGPLKAEGNHWGDRLGTPVEFFRLWWAGAQSVNALDHVVTLSSDQTALAFHLEGERSLKIAFDNGRLLIDDHPAGRYPTGGALDVAWRQLVTDAARHQTPEVVAMVHVWQPAGLTAEEAVLAALIRQRTTALGSPAQGEPSPQALQAAPPGGLTIPLTDLSDAERLAPLLRRAASQAGPDLAVTVPGGQARLGHFSLGSGASLRGPLLVIRGDADIFGTLEGNLATVDGDIIIHRGAIVTGDVLAVGGDVNADGGEIRGEIRTLRGAAPALATVNAALPAPTGTVLALQRAAGLTGILVSLLVLGMSAVLFAKQPLEIVSDTIVHSFARSFVVGVLGQILVVPTFGMLVVGLVLSVAGILLVPFVVVVYLFLAVLAILGGALAMAHATGEIWTRRRMAAGALIGSPNSYRYVLLGLAVPAILWAAWIVFGWVPLAGSVIFGIALLTSWLLLTVGFGATLLSRGGLREGFAGRILPAESLTDEYLWATPQFGVPAAKRPGHRTNPPLP
ncbi:MAG TPA: polymer-forming cytoskeletal protein [Gemmatimonadales bacterium]|nr:polymer-forming cytoskeletal protein [Gemmatimonadales bacterium]